MISKELLEAVHPTTEHDKYFITQGERPEVVHQMSGSYGSDKINIYELTHDCKKWAVKSKGFIFSKLIKFDNYTQWQVVIKQEKIEEQFIANTEPEAVFEACEYILNRNKG